MHTWFGKVAIGVLCIFCGYTYAWSHNHSLSFGTIIHRSPTSTAQFWNPILHYISAQSGVPLQLKVSRTGLEHTTMVKDGAFAFLYSNHNFLPDNAASGYRVFARPQGQAATGEIVVLADLPIHSLADLEGKEVAFPHPAAFLGYHLPMDALLRLGIHVKPLFAGTQEGAMGQLKAGRSIAAGVNTEVMQAFSKREHLNYRVLWRSEGYLSMALSAHPAVHEATVQRVQDAFLAMAQSPAGRKVLAASAAHIQQTSPLEFIAAHDGEFDNMRQFYRTTVLQVHLP